MYSRIKIAGHPVHPMLVGFPVALYTATLACYAACALGADPFWFRVGVYANLAGVVMAVVAALPGFIDWAFGIPSGIPAKATGWAHMLFNVAALVVFAANAYLQWGQRLALQPATTVAVLLALLGVCLTIAAGFLGWKMVQVHHVGVELTSEQQRLEPRSAPPAERSGTLPEARHGHHGG
jgi:uncharacterized membrane protein